MTPARHALVGALEHQKARQRQRRRHKEKQIDKHTWLLRRFLQLYVFKTRSTMRRHSGHSPLACTRAVAHSRHVTLCMSSPCTSAALRTRSIQIKHALSSASSSATGFEALHFRHVTRVANCTSLHILHNQSPLRTTVVPLAASAGFSLPHRMHDLRDANWT